VATLARYPQKRPPGLRVDASGALSLDNLVASWGKEQGLSKAQVLSALEKHKHHDGTDLLRFQMTPDPDGGGGLSIRVHRSRDGVTGTGKSLATACASVARTAQKGVGSRVGAPPWSAWNSARSDAQETEDWDNKPWGRKGDWRSKRKWDDSRKKGRGSWKKQEWKGGDWKQGLTVGEKVQRWLSYALRAGAEELGIEVEGGWASMEELVEALERTRSELGVSTVEQLRDTLRDSDLEGRFEMDDRGRLRKVDRDDRQPKPAAAVATKDPVMAKAAETFALGVAAPAATAEPPPNPPGPGWQRCIDEDVMWWYYEGPHGKWWKQEEDEKPQPWTDD